METAREIWAFAGAKGGVGCTVITAGIGFQLARLGRRALIVDADFSHPGIRGALGTAGRPASARPLHEFLRSDDVLLDAFIEETAYPGLLVASVAPSAVEPKLPAHWTQRFRSALLSLSVDAVLVDAGAGFTLASLDFMNLADQIVILTQPEATANEGVAALLRRLVVRRLATRAAAPRLRQFAARWIEDLRPAPRSIPDLLDAVAREDAFDRPEAAARLQEIELALLATGVRDEADRAYGQEAVAVIRRRFGLRCRFSGNARFDDAILRTQRQGRFCMVEAHRSQGADDIRKAARHLLSRADLSPVF